MGDSSKRLKTMAKPQATLYRSLLREIRLGDPVHKFNKHRQTSSVISSVRTIFASQKDAQAKARELDELRAFLRANRLHQTLLERYNAGINMSQEERARLSARRVGLNMPKEYYESEEEGKKSSA